MSKICQNELNPDQAPAFIVGRTEQWSPGALIYHQHTKHQLMYATRGVVHALTAAGVWVLPPSRALWIAAGTEHALKVKRPAETKVLYVDSSASNILDHQKCTVVNVSLLVRELILACADLPWDYTINSAQSRLSLVLIDQLQTLNVAPVSLPNPIDSRAVHVADILRKEPSNREPLAILAQRAGASSRTIERLFLQETQMTFGAWRHRQRLITALEFLAYGESVTNIAFEVGYESASSFVAAFREMFGTTPARYFKMN